MTTPTRALARAFAVVLCALGCGCATYTQKAMQVREPLERGDFESAQLFLEEKTPGGEGLPFLMELGLVLRYDDELQRSNEILDRAEIIVDELYTKSISREALALLTSDEMLGYDGEMWERVLVNYYRALNYIDLGEYEDALVECRKINHKLRVYVDSSEKPPTYRTDAFAQYLTALLFEAGGELNDAWVSLRLAEEAYVHYTEAYAVPPPPSMTGDMLRLAEDLGYRDEADRIRESYPEVAYVPTEELLRSGEIVLFYEEGFIPAKVQRDITIPILKTEWETEHAELAQTLSERAATPFTYKKTELDYLLRVALPDFPPAPTATAHGYAVLTVGADSHRTELAENLSAIARQGLRDRMPRILLKTVLRGLTKYALTRGLKSENEAAGTIFNLFAAAAEKADTRGWITLPATIQIARLVVPPGVHDVEVQCYDANGTQEESIRFEQVEINAGEVRFLSHRSF